MISILVILSFLGFSTAYAYDHEDDHRNEHQADIAIIIALTVVTVFFLLAGHDRHGGHRHFPRHLALNIPFDSRNNDNNQNDNWYQEKDFGKGEGKKWEEGKDN